MLHNFTPIIIKQILNKWQQFYNKYQTHPRLSCGHVRTLALEKENLYTKSKGQGNGWTPKKFYNSTFL